MNSNASATELFRQILLGGTLADKLAGMNTPASKLDWSPPAIAVALPDEPGRVGALRPRETTDADRFPKKSELSGPNSARARGRLLHFFANHELLAIETMAYTMLKFADAPVEFRQGVFRILQEEQTHLSAYIERMKDYGVSLGELPLNFYFWNSLKTLESPFDFVTRMSMTFEQANLDFALEYEQFFRNELKDIQTADLLRRVHDDEVKHVAHGVYWFNQWRGDRKLETEWDDYRQSLPFPMSPRRARGSGSVFAAESRRAAGLSDDYIESVRITGGSRGRVPDLFFYNPQCEIEADDVKLSTAAREKILDLQWVLFWFAQEDDLVMVSHEPPKDWLKEVFEWRGQLPEWIVVPNPADPASTLPQITRPIDSLVPWGFGRSAFHLQESLGKLLRKKQPLPLAVFEQKLLSKAWWKEVAGSEGAVLRSRADADAYFRSATGDAWILKAEHSTSGRGHRVVKSVQEAADWISKSGGGKSTWVIEPYYKKLADFSVQYELSAKGAVKRFEPRFFETDARHQYLGSDLGVSEKAHYETLNAKRFEWTAAHQKVIQALIDQQYVGPFGIDGLIAEGSRVIPVIEVNVRLTMGRLAQELEAKLRAKNIQQGKLKVFSDLTGFVSWSAFADDLKQKHAHRVIFVTPPQSAKNSLMAVIYNSR